MINHGNIDQGLLSTFPLEEPPQKDQQSRRILKAREVQKIRIRAVKRMRESSGSENLDGQLNTGILGIFCSEEHKIMGKSSAGGGFTPPHLSNTAI